jgi:hypothetical protein
LVGHGVVSEKLQAEQKIDVIPAFVVERRERTTLYVVDFGRSLKNFKDTVKYKF